MIGVPFVGLGGGKQPGEPFGLDNGEWCGPKKSTGTIDVCLQGSSCGQGV